jgi:hypothetical protein
MTTNLVGNECQREEVSERSEGSFAMFVPCLPAKATMRRSSSCSVGQENGKPEVKNDATFEVGRVEWLWSQGET